MTATCNGRLEVCLAKQSTAHSVRCNLEPHGLDTWHRGPEGTRWKSTDSSLMCQVRVEDKDSGGFLSYTCFRPTPCDVPGHHYFQPSGLDQQKRMHDMGGNAHEAVTVTKTVETVPAVPTLDEEVTTTTVTETVETEKDA